MEQENKIKHKGERFNRRRLNNGQGMFGDNNHNHYVCQECKITKPIGKFFRDVEGVIFDICKPCNSNIENKEVI
tara:strand:- start:225 stop:446 length:222 start_codon:yes stop_codon:yes gene_type:complete